MRPLSLAIAMVVLASACAVPVPTASERGRVPKPTGTVPTSTTATTSPTTTTTSPPVLTMTDQIEMTLADLDAFWSETLPGLYGIDYDSPKVLGGYDVDLDGPPVCGGEPLDEEVARGNALYCPADDSVAWDEAELFKMLFDDYGPFAVSLVLAHEWGHAIQFRGAVDQELPTILKELQADCYAGAWAGAAMAGNGTIDVGPSDLDTATAGFLLFRDPIGTTAATPGAHGSAFDRVGAFLEGVRTGVATCAAYPDDPPDVPLIVFKRAEEVASGGNLPAGDVIPTLSLTLDSYWTTTSELLGFAWDPFDAVDALVPGACPAEIRPGAAAAYCAPTDTLLLDDDGALQPLYENFGDFGPGFVLGLGWAEKALTLEGVDTSTATAGLRADCLVGNWAGAAVTGIPTGRTDANGVAESIALSPGDLDEAIQAILFLGDRQSGPADAFERVEAFRRGFFGEPADC